MRTRTPVLGTSRQKTAVQLGSSKMASEMSLPTFRTSMSKAVTTSMSWGRYPPISQWRRPAVSSALFPL